MLFIYVQQPEYFLFGFFFFVTFWLDLMWNHYRKLGLNMKSGGQRCNNTANILKCKHSVTLGSSYQCWPDEDITSTIWLNYSHLFWFFSSVWSPWPWQSGQGQMTTAVTSCPSSVQRSSDESISGSSFSVICASRHFRASEAVTHYNLLLLPTDQIMLF